MNWNSDIIKQRFETIKNLESDDGFDAPSLKTIICAENTALSLEQKGYPAPYNIIPGANREVIFEWKCDLFYFRLEFEDESCELNIFFDHRLIFRQPLQNCVI